MTWESKQDLRFSRDWYKAAWETALKERTSSIADGVEAHREQHIQDGRREILNLVLDALGIRDEYMHEKEFTRWQLVPDGRRLGNGVEFITEEHLVPDLDALHGDLMLAADYVLRQAEKNDKLAAEIDAINRIRGIKREESKK